MIALQVKIETEEFLVCGRYIIIILIINIDT